MTKELEEKIKAAQLAIVGLEKQFGKGVAQRGGNNISEIKGISTGNVALDMGVGIGGIPQGRITEIYGPESVGKSLIAQSCIGECQKLDGLTSYIDMEHALDPFWASKIGVQWNDMFLSQPQSAEEALTILDRQISSGAFDLIVVDSVSALTPQAEINGEIGDAHVALQSRLMSQALRMLNPKIAATNTAVIFINQLREKIGPMVGGTTTTSGGRALKFYASVRIELKRIETLKDKEGEISGFKVKANFIKNKVGPPFRTVEYKVMAGQGFDNYSTVLEYSRKFGFAMLKGAYYYLIDENGEIEEKPIGQGEPRAIEYLKDNPSVYEDLLKKVKAEYRSRLKYFEPEQKEATTNDQ